MEIKFKSNLKALRIESNMSQSSLAKAVGVTQQCVSAWEQGNMEPTLSNLWALSEIFGISIDFWSVKLNIKFIIAARICAVFFIFV